MEYKAEDLKRIREIELDLYHTMADICRKYNLKFTAGFGTALGAIRHKGFIPWDDDMDFLMPRKDFEKFLKVTRKELKGTKYEFLEPRTTKGYVMTFAKLSRKDTTFIEPTDKHFIYHTGVFIDIYPMDYWPQKKSKRNSVCFQCLVMRRLMTLATYPRPKFPPGLKSWKKALAIAACRLVHSVLKLSHISTEILYRKYLSLATSTSPEKADHFVTDMCWCWLRKLKNKWGIIPQYEMFGLEYNDEKLFDTVMVDFENDKVPVMKEYESYLTKLYKNYMELPPEDQRHSHVPEILELPDEK